MKDKGKFLESLKASCGIVGAACEAAGISHATYYRWRGEDDAFREKADDIMEGQVDFVESRLLSKIRDGDTTATIFYLKTKGKKRGWSERLPPVVAVNAGVQPDKSLPAPPAPEAAEASKVKTAKRVKNKKDYIVRLLKEQGKYTAELSMQVTITAQLLVRTEILAEEVLDEGHEAVSVEISREGNERRTVSPKERLYLDFVQQSQRALRALGMNTDAKERKTDNDTFGVFLKEFSEGSGE